MGSSTTPGSASITLAALPSADQPLVDDLPVLLVDDEDSILRALRRSLEPGGWILMTALGPEQALEQLRVRDFAAVLSDFRMPRMDGLALLCEVRSLQPDAERILLSACADEEALERGINDAAIHRFLRKPWQAAGLLAAVRQALQQNRVRRERAVLLERLRLRHDELSYLNRLLCNRVTEGDQAVRVFRRWWDTALDAISDPILVVGAEWRVEGANAASEALAGRPLSTMEGLPCYQILFSAPEPCPTCPLQHGSGSVSVRAGREEQIYEVRSYALPGATPTHLCVHHDVTYQVAMERQAAHLEKMMALGRMAGAVAHELNNPLQSIFTFAQLAEQDQVHPDKLRRYLQVVRESAGRCRDIVATLRDRARPAQHGAPKPIDLNQVCEAALLLFRTVGRNQVDWRPYPTGPALCCGHAHQLQQVVVNLVQNAIDASPAGSAVYVAVEARADQWVVSVEDLGPGVSKDIADRIFQPFFTTKSDGVGTGLGLWISQTIVEEHNGTLTLVKSGRGGARFEACFLHDPCPDDRAVGVSHG